MTIAFDQDARLRQQLFFLTEIDGLKTVLRQTALLDGSRRENAAEHSWHLSIMALVLAEHAAAPGLDLARVLKMLLLHDLVEIDAGDTFTYDEAGQVTKDLREQQAADRIFACLPADQAELLRKYWEEFEARVSPEARFAAALDRLQPLLHNYHTQGSTWKQYGITLDQVIARNRQIADGSPRLWEFTQGLLADAVAKGYLSDTDGGQR